MESVRIQLVVTDTKSPLFSTLPRSSVVELPVPIIVPSIGKKK